MIYNLHAEPIGSTLQQIVIYVTRV